VTASGSVLRPAVMADIPAMTAIYAHHVRHGTASFEIEPPDETEMALRRGTLLRQGFPWLVLEQAGEVLGYAYAGPWRMRPAYRWTAENSIYLRADAAGQGFGRRLLRALIAECESRGLRQLVAVVAGSRNEASLRLHESLGFRRVGTLSGVGWKHGEWLDSVLLQLALGAGATAAPRFVAA